LPFDKYVLSSFEIAESHLCFVFVQVASLPSNVIFVENLKLEKIQVNPPFFFDPYNTLCSSQAVLSLS